MANNNAPLPERGNVTDVLNNQAVPVGRVEGQAPKQVGNLPVSPSAYAAPGSSSQMDDRNSQGVSLEYLGNLDEVSLESITEDEDEGQGDFVVITQDIVRGYPKNRVVRISKVLSATKDKNVLRREAKRLFALGAIRQATSEESKHRVIEDDGIVTREVLMRERQARVNTEQKLAEIQKEFGKDEDFDLDITEEKTGKNK